MSRQVFDYHCTRNMRTDDFLIPTVSGGHLSLRSPHHVRQHHHRDYRVYLFSILLLWNLPIQQTQTMDRDAETISMDHRVYPHEFDVVPDLALSAAHLVQRYGCNAVIGQRRVCPLHFVRSHYFGDQHRLEDLVEIMVLLL